MDFVQKYFVVVIYLLLCGSSKFTSVSCLQLLISRQILNYGTWEPLETCPWGSYIIGMSLKSYATDSDSLGMTGVKFYCKTSGFNGGPTNIKLPFISSGQYPAGSFGKNTFCRSGIAVGYQLQVESYQGPLGDDTSVNNIRLLCTDDGESITRVQGESGSNYGHWRSVYMCPEKHILCGVQTQVNLETSSDGVGINNINMACCPGVDIPENEKEDVEESLKDYNSKASHKTSNGIYLRSSITQYFDLDLTTPFKGEYCSSTSKVNGIEIDRYSWEGENEERRSFISKILLICTGTKNKNEKVRLNSGFLPIGNLTTKENCPENAVGTGLQLYYDPVNFNLDRIDLICSKPEVTRTRTNVANKTILQDEPFDIEEDLALASIISKPMECKPGQFLCGLKTVVQYNEENTELSGVKEITVKCCDSSDPPPSKQKGPRWKPTRPPSISQKAVRETEAFLLFPSPVSIVAGETRVLDLERCNSGSFINGMSLKYGFGGKTLNGIKLQCVDSNGTQTNILSVEIKRFTDQTWKEMETFEGFGFATGFQLKARSKYGYGSNVTFQITDLRVFNPDLGALNWDEFEDLEAENDTGIWMGTHQCKIDEGLCGVQATVEGSGLESITRLSFACCEDSVGLNSSAVNYGSLLKSMHSAGAIFHSISPLIPNHNNAKWSTWDYCGDSHYASGFRVKRTDDKNVTGLQFLCANPTDPTQEDRIEGYLETISTMELPWGSYGRGVSCSGVGIGMQVAYKNGKISDIRLYCSWTTGTHGRGSYVQSEENQADQNNWESPQMCPSKYAICGIQTAYSRGENSMSGIGVKCCKVPHPSETCVPSNKWELIWQFDNRKGSSPVQYSLDKKIGLMTSTESKQSSRLEIKFAQSLGYETSLRHNHDQTNGSSSNVGASDSQSALSQANIVSILADTITKGFSRELGSTKSDTFGASTYEPMSISNSRLSAEWNSFSYGKESGSVVPYSIGTVFVSGKETEGLENDFGSESKSGTFIHEGNISSGTKSWTDRQDDGFTRINRVHTGQSNAMILAIARGYHASNAQVANQHFHIDESIDWSLAESKVWQSEVTESIGMTVNPGVMINFYQAVAHCSFYEVRSKFFKRIDEEVSRS